MLGPLFALLVSAAAPVSPAADSGFRLEMHHGGDRAVCDGVGIDPSPSSVVYQVGRYGRGELSPTLKITGANANLGPAWTLELKPADARDKYSAVRQTVTWGENLAVLVGEARPGSDQNLVQVHLISPSGVLIKRMGVGLAYHGPALMNVTPQGDLDVVDYEIDATHLYRFAPDGQRRFKVQVGPDRPHRDYPLQLAADGQGRAFVIGTRDDDGYLRAFDTNGDELWMHHFHDGTSPHLTDVYSDLRVTSTNRLVVTAKRMTKDSNSKAGAIGMWELQPDTGTMTGYARIETGNNQRKARDQVVVTDDRAGNLFVAWSHDAGTSRLAHVVFSPTSVNKPGLQAHRRTSPLVVNPVRWAQTSSAAGPQALGVTSSGHVVLLAGGEPVQLGKRRGLDVRAFDTSGRFVAGVDLPRALPPSSTRGPDLDVKDWAFDGNRVLLIGGDYDAADTSGPGHEGSICGATTVSLKLMRNGKAAPLPQHRSTPVRASKRPR